MKLIDAGSDGMPLLQPQNDLIGGRGGRLHDRINMRISLKQWRVLHAVIDYNGFTAAAEKLQISQSAISYTIAKMQEQLGVTLLKIEGRKAQITEEGRALLEQSRNVIRSAIELESLAEKMRQGWKPELRLMVHHECPQAFLMAAINRFCAGTPNIRVTVVEGSGDDLEQAIHDHLVDLAVCMHAPLGLVAGKLISVDYVAVAHPDHALARMPGPLTVEHFADHSRITIDVPHKAREWERERDRRPAQKPGKPTQWRVRNFDMALAALEQGLGYAWLPRERVQRQLENGSLKRLEVSHVYHSTKDFYLVRACKTKPGTGAYGLADMLCSHAAMRVERG
jgi:DNA-binding transcriptional LysR family regulator